MSRHKRFEELAEKILMATIRKGQGYTPPANAHMVVDTALAITEDFLHKLHDRREEMDHFDGLSAEESEMVRGGRKINAIKSVKDRTGMSFQESKKLVDKIESQMNT